MSIPVVIMYMPTMNIFKITNKSRLLINWVCQLVYHSLSSGVCFTVVPLQCASLLHAWVMVDVFEIYAIYRAIYILPCKSKRQYLLTCEVSFLALQSSIGLCYTLRCCSSHSFLINAHCLWHHCDAAQSFIVSHQKEIVFI